MCSNLFFFFFFISSLGDWARLAQALPAADAAAHLARKMAA
jgi:hypothetical protein